jgi:alkylation response protein AidB-like acyl-CoA dehydrogenase
VEFDFSEEQYELRDLARDLFQRESPPSRLRAMWGEDEPRDDKVWRTIAEAGLTGITVPEEFGGLGGDEVDLALVLEEAGRAALPEPLVETLAIAAPAIAEGGTDEQKREWLPRIGAGDAFVAVSFGDERWAPDADVADLLVVERDDAVHLVPRGSFATRRVRSEDGARRLFEVDVGLDSTTATNADGRLARFRAVAATATLLNGVAMKLLDLTLEHVKSRTQFERTVGSFQAVKHKLAEVAVEVDASRPAAWYAAYLIAQRDPGAANAARVAKIAANDAAHRANVEALQLHGGIGFTWEHDLHFWLKRGLALEAACGASADHRRGLAAHVFEQGSPG